MSPQRFAGDTRGSVAIIAALTATILIGMAALAIDVSQFYFIKRKQQTANDIAATVAAADMANAFNATQANLTANGFPPTTSFTIEPGTYTADPTIAANLRFVANAGATPNAVRVKVRTYAPMFFGTVFGSRAPQTANGEAGFVVNTQAVAATSNVAAFSIGSRTAGLSGGILNSVLGGLFGTQLTLSVMDYQALASTKLDLLAFSNALATRVNLTAATYQSLANANVRMGDIFAAIGATPMTGSSASGASGAVNRLSAATGVGGATFAMGKLIDYGPLGSSIAGASAPLSAQIDVLDLIVGAAQIANGQHEVQTTLGISLPGVATVSLKLIIGEPSTGSSLVAIGLQGTSVHTAQTRVLLTIQLLGSGSIAGMTLPVYVEVASAQGRMASINCAAATPGAPQVQLGVTPGAVDGWIGAVSDSDLTNLSAPVAPPAAALVTLLGLASVSGRAHATIGNTSETLIEFSSSDITSQTIKTVSTTDFTNSLVSNLLNSLQLNETIVGLGIGVPPGLMSATAAILASDLPVIDQIVASTLATLGVTAGDADSAVHGVMCGQSTVVD